MLIKNSKEVINIFKYIKNNKGQSMVEFALTIIPFLAFIFGLIACSLWGVAAFLTQETSHEVARKYAVTLEEDKAKTLGETYLKRWGYIFIEPNDIDINLQRNADGKTVQAKVVAKPRIKTIFIFSVPEISRTSKATMEDRFRQDRRQYYYQP